jgi:MoaA/NifB/PqqE/SkfB family radical SAM enzyme
MDTNIERIYPISSNRLLRLSAYLEENRIRIRALGPLAKVPAINAALGMLEGQIPVRADDKLYISTWVPPIPSRAFDRLRKSYLKSVVGIRTPDQVTISITEECPNRCMHCALPDSGQRLRLEPDTVKNVIGQVLELGTTLVIFDGGEPTLYKELPELVSSVDERGIATLFTSGAGFTGHLAKELKAAGLYAVNLSLDSPSPEEHDLIRGRSGAFRDAMRAARHALEADLLLDIYVVLRPDSIPVLQEFHRLARDLGADELTFFEIVPVGRWAGSKEAALSEDNLAMLERFVAISSEPRIFSVPSALKQFGCFAGQKWLHITPGGDVYPCACMPHVMGSIFREPVAKIWRRMGKLAYRGNKTCPMRKSGR